MQASGAYNGGDDGTELLVAVALDQVGHACRRKQYLLLLLRWRRRRLHQGVAGARTDVVSEAPAAASEHPPHDVWILANAPRLLEGHLPLKIKALFLGDKLFGALAERLSLNRALKVLLPCGAVQEVAQRLARQGCDGNECKLRLRPKAGEGMIARHRHAEAHQGVHWTDATPSPEGEHEQVGANNDQRRAAHKSTVS